MNDPFYPWEMEYMLGTAIMAPFEAYCEQLHLLNWYHYPRYHEQYSAGPHDVLNEPQWLKVISSKMTVGRQGPFRLDPTQENMRAPLSISVAEFVEFYVVWRKMGNTSCPTGALSAIEDHWPQAGEAVAREMVIKWLFQALTAGYPKADRTWFTTTLTSNPMKAAYVLDPFLAMADPWSAVQWTGPERPDPNSYDMGSQTRADPRPKSTRQSYRAHERKLAKDMRAAQAERDRQYREAREAHRAAAEGPYSFAAEPPYRGLYDESKNQIPHSTPEDIKANGGCMT